MELVFRKKIYQEYSRDFIELIKQEQEKWEEQDYGLSIAKEVIEQNNGNINIKSKVGKGTEVVIRIPVYKKELEEQTEENNTKKEK